MSDDPICRAVQAMPIERWPVHLAGDTNLSGCRPRHRVPNLIRRLPPVTRGLGRKPWDSAPDSNCLQRFLLDLAADVSPCALAARRMGRDLDMYPEWWPLSILQALIHPTPQVLQHPEGGS